MSILLTLIAILLVIPFIAWGVHILRLQLVYREELETVTKWITVAGVVIFVTIELNLFRVSLGSSSGYYLLTALALITSTTALYGHLFVSIASQMAVDMIHPPREHESDDPDFAAAEALEEVGDYDGALSEYMVIARIFPKDPDPILKIADTYMQLNDIKNAARFFEKGLAAIGFPERALRITNRLSGIYARQLNQPDDAKRILAEFLVRFPNAEQSATVQSRIDRMDDRKPEPRGFKSATGMLEAPRVDLSE